jgi:hypothetical protein
MLLVADGPCIQLRDGRWGEFFVDQQRTKPPFLYIAVFTIGKEKPAPLSVKNLEDVFGAVEGSTWCNFMACTTSSAIDAKAIQAIAQGFSDALPGVASGPHGVFAFPQDPAQVDLSKSTSITLGRSGKDWCLASRTSNVVLHDTGPSTVFLVSTESHVVDVGLSSDNKLTIGSVVHAQCQVGQATVATNAVLTFDFSSEAVYGARELDITPATEPAALPLGFGLCLTSNPSITSPNYPGMTAVHYPLFDAPGFSALVGHALSFCIDGGGAVLLYIKDSAPVSSAYRTTYGEPVMLLPPQGGKAAFKGQYLANGRLLFAPTNDWQVSVTRADVKSFNVVCGLSGLEFVTLCPGDTLNFFPDNPADVWAEQTAAASAGTGLAPHLRWPTVQSVSVTSYVAPTSTTGPTPYTRQSQAVPLFDILSDPDGFLDAVEPADFDLATQDLGKAAFPMFPYAGGIKPGDAAGCILVEALEGSIIASQREARVLQYGQPPQPSGSALTAITPQGFVLTFAQGDELTSVQFAASADQRDVLAIQFTKQGEWASKIKDALGSAQPFIVISIQDPSGESTITSGVALDGWTLDVSLASQAQAAKGSYGSIVIVKAAGAAVSHLIANPDTWNDRKSFNESDIDQSGQVLSGYLKDYIDQTRKAYADGSGVADYADFLDTIDNPSWSGVLVLNAPVDIGACPPVVQAMLIGTDTSQSPVCAHHIIATPGRITLASGQATAGCSFDAVIHYLRPGITLASLASNQLGILPSTGQDQFLLMNLRAVFKSAVLKHFRSSAGLVMSQVLGEPVASASLDGGLNAGTNAVIVDGVMHRSSDGTPVYAFVTPSVDPSIFYLNSFALDSMLVDQVSTTITQTSSQGVTNTKVAFRLGGWLRMRLIQPMDILSYESIGMDGMTVVMNYTLKNGQPSIPTFAFDTSALVLSASQELALSSVKGSSPTKPTTNVFRDNSLVAQWPMKLGSMVVPSSGQMPEDLGYQKVILPSTAAAPPDIAGAWLGVALPLALGTSGMASTSHILSAEMLLGWPISSPQDSALLASVTPFFKLIGPDGASLQFEVEGVISIGIAAVKLRTTNVSTPIKPVDFILELQGIGLTVLGKTFPMNGGATVFLGGVTDNDGTRSLGWFGGVGSMGD